MRSASNFNGMPDESKGQNLNRMTIETHQWFQDSRVPLQSNHMTVKSAEVSCYFRDIEQMLIEKILSARVVVGCVAWLTSFAVLRALQKVEGGVSIIVQKEDFLRPDIGAKDGWKRELRTLYDSIPMLPDRCSLAGLVGSLSVCGDPGIAPIRCMGNHNSEKSPAFPRMHNKFLVFCSADGSYEERYTISPVSVWTGSFNLTANSRRSLENAVLITDAEIASRYYVEWEQILALSEPLDWETEWCAPEWRIGS